MQQRGDLRGVVRAVNDHELVRFFGYAALYGAEHPVPDVYVQRTCLILRARAEAEAEEHKAATSGAGHGNSGTSTGSGAGGERVVSRAVGEGYRRRKSVLDTYE